ncbi:hypothetical protein AWZ03_014726 [Drosophila navojoa]|uniref:Reverse transcriptase/retrotransposon-derived protein RNase H-like domain-containing protein n=1 Tax=Drosophila navojoa TaxID=7232 RepID=A0A484AQA9_DRONA|nr:hypothetical protein AWZ03_014726 [Drosophila navojoa]
MAAEYEKVRNQRREQEKKIAARTPWFKPAEGRQSNLFRAQAPASRFGEQTASRTTTPASASPMEATSQRRRGRITKESCEQSGSGAAQLQQGRCREVPAPSKEGEDRRDEGQRMTATIDTVATRSFVSEDCVRQRTMRGEYCDVESRIRLAESALNVMRMIRTHMGLARKTAEAILLRMPTMLDYVVLGMDFLCAIGTMVRSGKAELKMRMVELPVDVRSAPDLGTTSNEEGKIDEEKRMNHRKTVEKRRKWLKGSDAHSRALRLDEGRQTSEAEESLTTAPILAGPDFSAKFVLQTDASDDGLGALLTQEIEGQERVIAYAS